MSENRTITVVKEKGINITSAKAGEGNELQAAIIEIVKRKDIDPERLQKFLDIQIKMEDRQNKKAFFHALAGFQGDCPLIKKTKNVNFKNVNYNFAPLDEIAHITKPFLKKWGLSFSFNIVPTDDSQSVKLVTKIQHAEGHAEDFDYYFNPVLSQQGMNDSQARKSALTYAKRAALENALGIVTAGEDDDARRLTDASISDTQLNNILDLMDATGTTEEMFFKFMKIKNLEDLTQPEADKAIKSLIQKRKMINAKGKL